MIMYVNCIETENGLLVAVCDEQLLGQKFEEEDKILDLTGDFYKGDQKTEEEIADIIRNAYILNVVGEKSVKLAMREGVLDDENIQTVQGIPHAQIMLVG